MINPIYGTNVGPFSTTGAEALCFVGTDGTVVPLNSCGGGVRGFSADAAGTRTIASGQICYRSSSGELVRLTHRLPGNGQPITTLSAGGINGNPFDPRITTSSMPFASSGIAQPMWEVCVRNSHTAEIVILRPQTEGAGANTLSSGVGPLSSSGGLQPLWEVCVRNSHTGEIVALRPQTQAVRASTASAGAGTVVGPLSSVGGAQPLWEVCVRNSHTGEIVVLAPQTQPAGASTLSTGIAPFSSGGGARPMWEVCVRNSHTGEVVVLRPQSQGAGASTQPMRAGGIVGPFSSSGSAQPMWEVCVRNSVSGEIVVLAPEGQAEGASTLSTTSGDVKPQWEACVRWSNGQITPLVPETSNPVEMAAMAAAGVPTGSSSAGLTSTRQVAILAPMQGPSVGTFSTSGPVPMAEVCVRFANGSVVPLCA